MTAVLDSTPQPTHVAAPRPAVTAVVVIGTAAAALLPLGRLGVGLLLVGLLAAAVLARLAPRPLAPVRLLHAGLALLLLGSAAVRDAQWLVGLNLLGALALGSLALVRAGSWPGVLRGLVEVVYASPWVPRWLLRGMRAVLPARLADLGPAARGAALTLLVLVVFGALLTSGDSAFALVVEKLLPDLRSDVVTARVVLGALAALGAAAAALVLLAPRGEPALTAPRRRLGHRSEWLPPLVGLDLLLAAFLVVQGTVLFGGDDHVLATAGVTYASYVHQGFGQLVVVTLLVLAVVGATARYVPREPAARAAVGVLCLLTLVIAASTLWRMHLYTDAYGLTRLRILVAAFVGWLAVVLVVALVGGERPGRWVPHTVVATGALVLLGLTAANPDAAIARSALERGAAADLSYLASLSDDAAPVLDRLPEPARSCALLSVRRPTEDWRATNLARVQAERLLDQRPVMGSGLPLGLCPAERGYAD